MTFQVLEVLERGYSEGRGNLGLLIDLNDKTEKELRYKGIDTAETE